MNYNFDETVNRRGTHCMKWDESTYDDLIPMWVADMDFRVAPCIEQALARRVAQGVFGYVSVPDDYYQSVIRWFRRRHGWTIRRERMLYTLGVVPAISAIIKAMTSPGDRVLVQTPVYNCFFSSIRNNGCEMVSNDLVYCTDADGVPTYRIDFDDLQRKAADPAVKVMIVCNPHNPAGRVWTPDELRRIGTICLENDVFVISDEIHCELVRPGYRYTPFASLSDDFLLHSATCISPSKAFNTAGLQIASIVVGDQQVKGRIDRAININEVCDVNPFGIEATMAAYSADGEAWLNELLTYIYANCDHLVDFMASRYPQLPVVKLEGTYLAWIDCRPLGKPSEQMEAELLEQQHLWINGGTHYGPSGEGFLRINLACPRRQLDEALGRLDRYLRNSGLGKK